LFTYTIYLILLQQENRSLHCRANVVQLHHLSCTVLAGKIALCIIGSVLFTYTIYLILLQQENCSLICRANVCHLSDTVRARELLFFLFFCFFIYIHGQERNINSSQFISAKDIVQTYILLKYI